MAEDTQISDADLIRVLGEYTAKANSAHRDYVSGLFVLSIGTALVVAAGSVFTGGFFFALGDISGTALTLILSAILAVGTTAVVVYIATQKTAVELATWQLRRVYELVSRREDLGVDVDSGTRLEMELRLGEAAFLLTTLERFERPEKFRRFQRMSRNSPFREIEPETSPRSPETKPSSAPSPDYSGSAS
ncbi:MAG TPA: hypothetical protein VK034_16485 [Enhygromyxa sp.]|nr:hypothetical protein [Enhygromyxa sp.]